ncbi:MAG: SGNH/GDSL hydrolase family protein [Bacteroidales bacterium]|nr:SGNH/GDSL hydrolase family protein [Bacteroidales bacterium]
MKKLLISFATVILLSLLPAFGASPVTKGKKVVFIGDSITDGNWGIVYNYKPTSAERSQTDLNHIYGHSFVMLIASDWLSRHPGCGHKFFNRGFSGHKLSDLAGRWKEDVLDLDPDVLTVLIGRNDVHSYCYHRKADTPPFDFEAWENTYRELLRKTREKNPSVKIVLIPPFLEKEGPMASAPDYDLQKEMTSRMALITRKLCDEFGGILLPVDEMFDKLIAKQPEPGHWVWDGVHPSAAGHRRIANLWEKKVKL